MNLNIYDTAIRGKRSFTPLVPGQVSIYVCGLTVYDLPHIGHARTFIVFDFITRFLRSRGLQVTLVRNHTDIDDKIIRRAQATGLTPAALAQQMIAGLDQDMQQLDVIAADVAPRVTEHIPEIIALIETLVAKGVAYVVEGDVYYRVSAFPEYGKLSNRNLDDLLSGARVEVDNRKEHPADFALWKASKETDEPAWDSPWGPGRPGWHIECSAMSMRYLGPTFDIHGGGRDLIFPHHENEVAQSVAANACDFARYWMHVGMVEIEGEKMSHSLNNFWTVRDILQQVHPEALRYFFLTAHYRHNINFCRDAIQEATTRITCFYRTLSTIGEILAAHPAPEPTPTPESIAEIAHLLPSFNQAMEDDFNTPRALAALAEAARIANEWVEQKGKITAERVQRLYAIRQVLLTMGLGVGILQRPTAIALAQLKDLAVKRLGLDPAEIDDLVARRARARKDKDWNAADSIRLTLEEKGVRVLDRPSGSCWIVN